MCSFSSGVRRRGVWGIVPPENFWIFRLKTHGFLSFEAPYPMHFFPWLMLPVVISHNLIIATSSDRTTLIFFHVCSECIPTGTNSSRKEAGNWLENLRASQGTTGCCRASTIFVAFVTKKNASCFTRSLVAWSPAGLLWKTKAPELLSDWTSASISEKVNISWGQRSIDAINPV